jgi:Outer membrane protein beta-barrel domain
MRPLLAGKISVLLFAFAALAPVAGAQRSPDNALRYDLRAFNLGFMAGLNIPSVNLAYGSLNGSKFTPGVLRNLTFEQTPGINLGMITNFRLHNNWDVRFIPAVSLQERRFNYIFSDRNLQDSIYSRTLEAAFVDLPLMLKFKSDVYHNYRVYVLLGAKYSRNLISDKRARADPDLIRIGQNNFCIESGIGLDIYSDRVKLCPEIRYSLGVNNMYESQNTRFGNVIQSLNLHNILICINFE